MVNKKIIITIITLLYIIINYYNLSVILYPINIIVALLHELGHGIMSILSGGEIVGIQINTDGSGYAITSGGNRLLTLIGGYIGSIIFGNILIYLGLIGKNVSRASGIILGILFCFISLFYFNSIISTLLILSFGLIIFYLFYKFVNLSEIILISLGIISVIHIILDYNVGPSSDINKIFDLIGFSNNLITISFLMIAIIITYLNLKLIIKNKLL